MAANELKITIAGNTTVVFNDFSGGTPAYLLHHTPELLSTLSVRQTKSPKQGAHGITDSLSFYDERPLTFDGEILGSSQADRKTKEEALKQCLALPTFQSFTGADGYFLVQITDEDGSLKQCYAKVLTPPKFSVLDNTNPARRAFAFVMLAKDPRLYSQSLQSSSGMETVIGTNFQVVQSVSPTVPFQLYKQTVPTLTVSAAGTEDAPPILTVNGPTQSPKVTNVTTGIFMDFSGSGGLTLLSGEKLVIDVANYTITKYDASNVASNASGYLTAASNWILLAAGTNVLTLLDISPDAIVATLQCQWRDTYI